MKPKINWGVYKDDIGQGRFVHFTTGELPEKLNYSTLVKVCITQREAWEAAGLEWTGRDEVVLS